MKSIPNKTVIVKGFEKKYSDLIMSCLEVTPKEGFTVPDMRIRLQVMDIAEKANGSIELEHAHIDKLKECIKKMPWNVLSKEVLAFCEEIEKL